MIWFTCYIVSTLSFIFVIYLMDHLFLQEFITVVCFDLTNIHCYYYFLGEFIQKLKLSSQANVLSRHTLLAILLLCIWDFSHFDQWIKQTLSVRYFTEFIRGTSDIEQWFNHTICVSYFTKMHSGFSQINQWISYTL